MEYFKPLTIDDQESFKNYEKLISNKSYEYSFNTLFLWKDFSNVEYSIIDNCLIVKKTEENNGVYFMMPYGYTATNLENLVKRLKELSTNINNSIYLFGDIEDSFIKDLHTYTNYEFKIINDRNDYEYIYLTKDLIDLSGKKYHSKKNHYNTFKNSYEYEIASIDSQEKINDCIELLKKWHANKVIISKELSSEISEIYNCLSNIDKLNLKTIGIYVNNQLVGFSIGEIFRDTAIIHVERCDINYKGVYAFINREFLIKDFNDTIYVNRQEDCGSTGLRTSKYSYHPIELLRKSLIVI